MAEIKTSVRLPEELHRRAREKCRREDITLSQVIRRCLREWVRDDSPEQEDQPRTD